MPKTRLLSSIRYYSFRIFPILRAASILAIAIITARQGFAEIKTFGDLRANVIGGNVTLSGETLTVGSKENPQIRVTAFAGGASTVTVAGNAASFIKPSDSADQALSLGTMNGIATFNVADAKAELHVSVPLCDAISRDGRSGKVGSSGLVKTGEGTLRIAGEVRLSGFITHLGGTLDFSKAKLSERTRINLASRGILIVPEKGSSIAALYHHGNKLEPGRWGAKGSVAAGLADHELALIQGKGVLTVANTGRSVKEHWKTMKYGFFVHYVWDAVGKVPCLPDGKPTPGIDYLADHFDAAGFADDLASMGVEYVVFTAWQANCFPLYDSTAIARHFPGRSPKRDMIGDMIASVRAKGIRVLLYTHPYQPLSTDMVKHNAYIRDAYAELTDRYGDRIDGYYLDENDPMANSDKLVDYPGLERAIHLRNPELLMLQNFYGNLYSCDVGSGESPVPQPDFSNNLGVTRPNSYAQIIGSHWFATVPKGRPAVTRSAEGIYRSTVVAAGSCTEGGGMFWAAGPFSGNGMLPNPATGQKEFKGRWEDGVLEAMQKAASYIRPVEASIKNTYPSTSWPAPQGVSIGDLPWGVATRSTDDKREYIHVLKAPAGKTLTLPPPADGKIFTHARLLASGRPVALAQTPAGVTFTLPASESWNSLDTVIALDVVKNGGKGLANNTRKLGIRGDDPSVIYGHEALFNNTATKVNNIGYVTYTGSWQWQKRDAAEHEWDVHWTAKDGDSFAIHFNGTGVQFEGNGFGIIDVYLDDKFIKTTDMRRGRVRVVGANITGLPSGKHTLKGVKKGDTYVQLDSFRIYDPKGGSWTRQVNRGADDDLHVIPTTTVNEDYVELSFNGTGIELIAPKGPDGGTFAVYLDDQPVGSFSQYQGTAQEKMTVFSSFNVGKLPPGPHRFRAVKKHGGRISVDGFVIYQPFTGARN